MSSSMATSPSQAIKCLNTSTDQRRFVFKTFSQRVEEINIDVFHSLEPIRFEPKEGPSFLWEALVYWRELNTAEDFISFYEEMMPLVQTLPQILLHKEKIFSELLGRLHMGAKLSIEPILMLVVAFSRDILKDFLPFLRRLAHSITCLLLAGGDRDPEILEQVFKAWSYIIMYLQKNLEKDVVTLLKITVQLRYYPKDYVQEFVAEAVSFLLRNASLNELKSGIRRILVEVAKISSSHRKMGASSLIWHTMRGTSSRLHSRAKTVFLLLLKEPALNIKDVPQEAVLEVLTGILQRLCEEIDPKEQNVVYECLFECIHGRITQGCLAQVDPLLTLLITAIRLSRSGEVLDSIKMSELVRLLIEVCIPLADRKSEGCSSEVVFPALCNKILQLVLCLLDMPQNCSYIDIIVEFAPQWKLEESCLLMFVKGLILKDPGVVLLCRTYIFSAFDEMIDVSPDEVLFLMLSFFKRQSYNIANGIPAKICKFLTDTIYYWCELLNSIATISSLTDLFSKLTVLWGVISCYPYFPHTMENVMQVKNLIDKLDQLLKCEVANIAGAPVSIWQDLLGVTLDSYQKLLLRECGRPADACFFLSLAKRYKSSPCILSAVAEYFDSSLGSNHEAGVSLSIFSEIGVEDPCISINLFADNLSMPNKEIRIATLRILSHCALLDEYPTSEDRPNKKVKYEGSVSFRASRCINVVDVLLSIERTPISVFTSRKIFILISKLQTALSSGMVNEDYVPLLLNGFIGILHNRFSPLWDHVMECLTILIRRFKKNAWDLFFHHLEFYQVKALSLDIGASKLKSEIPQAKTLAECFNQYLAHEFDSTPCTTVLTLLLQVLQKAPNIAESYSHQLIPLFLNFLGYTGVDSVGSFIQQKCKGKEWRSILKEWLNLLKLMHNCRSLYKNQVLKDVLVNRLLDDSDPDIQLKSIECLLNWKDDYLIPYHQHLRNIIVPKNLREELITWDISQNSGHVEDAHRAQLIPIVVRLLSPKVRKSKTFAPRKYASVNNRRAILCFLSQLEVGELHLFFLLLLKSLFGRDHGTVTLEGHSDSVLVVQRQTFSLLNGSIFKAIENLTLKKKYGLLYVLEDVFKTFDAFHIRPFLSSLMKLVSLILKSCMSTKKNEDGNQIHSSGCCLSGDFGVDDAAISAQSSAVMSKTTKQVKDLRSLCLKIISLALNKHDSLDFGDEFWDIFFQSVKPLIDAFKHEGSSSEKPSSLFSCFLALSRSPALVSYLNREENLVPSIFSILTVRTASDAIISSVLNFIENLLKLDNDFVQENDFVKEVFYPHLEVLIHSFHELFQARIRAHRKFIIWPGKSELKIFKMMVKYITNPLLAAQFLDILLPFFKRKMLDFDDCLEALNILNGILQHLTSEGYKISGKILKAIHPILAVAGSDIRLCICDIINCLAGCDPSLTYLDGLLQKLNAVSSTNIGELDYDTRVIAYETISPELFSSHVADHALVILSHCIYDMSSDELILRQCASKSLLAFIHFASSLLKKDAENSLADCAECKEAPTGVETGQLNWTKAGIQWVIKSILLKNMRESMTKDISIQKEWVSLLRDMVYNLHEISDLNSIRPLCSQDAEVDFFNNILHLQVHRKRRALLRFKNAISCGNFAENIVVNIFVPLFFNMMINAKDGKGERIRDACLDSLASIAIQMQWKSYCSFLMRCFREITVHPDKQKILVRLVCAILDNFHFYASSSADMEKVPQVTSGVVVQGHSVRHVPPDIEIYLQKAVLPRIQKLLIMDSEKVNVNVSLAGLKLLKLLPADAMDSQLSSIIHRICNFLKNRLESLRDEARSALAVCANELGIEYLLFIIKILRATLKRGYEMHVLGYTLNLILSKTLTRYTIGSLDYCLEELLSIVENDILGDVAEEKEVGKIASKMKETRRNKSFETLKLISQSITFRTHAVRLLSPIYKHMEQHIIPKTKRKLEIMLLNIASGIECNPSVQTDELFVFVYGLIEDSIVSEFSQSRGRLEALSNEKYLHDVNEKEKISCINAIVMKNSHLISVFALGVLHNRLKNMKVDKNDQHLLSMLDPFVKQLGDCLNSKYEDVLSAAFRCLALLIQLPLPSFDMYANKIKALLLCIAERSGNGNTPMVQSCLKLLMVLLRCSRISISDDELHLIIQFPMFIDIQTTPSPLALSLLKSIVAQKLVVHEIYDIILRVAELMVTTLSEPIRKKCSQILLQFLLDYQLSEKRLQQHLDFLLSNLSYEHPFGREAVLEMLHAIIIKLPERVIDNNVQTFFLHLVVALANEHNQKVRSMVSTVLKALINKTSDRMLEPILEYSLSWYFGEKQNLWSAAAQVIGLLTEVLKGGIEKDISAIVQTATKILKVSIDAVHGLELGFSSELVGVPLWKEANDSLLMLEKILLHFPDLYFQLAFKEIWGMVCKFLLHPHVWLRNISSRLVALYFAAVSERSRADSEKINQTTLYLINPSILFSIAVSFLTQLETQEMDDSIGKIIAQNIVFSICGLHSFAKQKYHTSFRKMWSMLDVSEQNCYLEAFDLLGSRQAKRTFVLSTSVTSQFPTKEEDTSALENVENLQLLLIVPLLRKLGKIAMGRDDSQLKIIFNCLRMISSQIGTQGISDYSVYILLPVYKVCEGYAGKLISDDVKQFAEEVRNGMRDLLGVDLFVQLYNQIRKKLKGKRDKRRQHQKLIAVINPMLHAKRKLRVAAKHRANKRRKIEAIKMGKRRT